MKILFALTLLLSPALCDQKLSSFQSDRAAILKLAGEFRVDFRFEETLAIQEGYLLNKPYRESAHELVKVVADTGDSITLQHLLVVQEKGEGEEKGSPSVIKHWTQTWTYEDPTVLKYVARRRWEKDSLAPAQYRGAWTQFVTQVDDSPRYEGYGRWEHHKGRSIWISNQTYRPLPRREYTKRQDYDLVECVNRHVITEAGWVHEQYNAKLVRREGESEHYISHEIGLNKYTRVSDYDFSPAEDYWTKFGHYWDEVREVWKELYAKQSAIKLKRYANDETLREMIYEVVEDAQIKGAKQLPPLKTKILAYFSK